MITTTYNTPGEVTANGSALEVMRNKRVWPDSEEVTLGQGAGEGHEPGNDQHHLGTLGVGPVGDGEHDGRQSVKGDDNHHKTRGIEPEDPETEYSCDDQHKRTVT